MSQGIVFVFCKTPLLHNHRGKEFRCAKELVNAYKYIVRYTSIRNITIITDTPDLVLPIDVNCVYIPFPKQKLLPYLDLVWFSSLYYKTMATKYTPYDKTIALDCDVAILGELNELYDVLNHYDFAACLAPLDHHWPVVNNIPLTAVTPFNTGVLCFNKSKICEKTLSDWADIYFKKLENNQIGRHSYQGDQTSFTESVILNKASVCTLHNRYNLRTVHHHEVTSGEVKIVHDRAAGHKFLSKINKNKDIRYIGPGKKIYNRNNDEVL